MIRIAKYEFDTQQQAQQKIQQLGYHLHSIVEIGHIIQDEEGLVISDKYSVDVAWRDLTQSPEDWQQYEIQLDNEGVHGFMGVSYLDNKFE